MNPGTPLIVNERPLLVPASMAAKIGLNEAIVLVQVHFEIAALEASHDQDCAKNGCYWVRRNLEEWQASAFPFWSIPTVKRVFRKLELDNILIREKFDKIGNTWWTTVNYKKLHKMGLTVS